MFSEDQIRTKENTTNIQSSDHKATNAEYTLCYSSIMYFGHYFYPEVTQQDNLSQIFMQDNENDNNYVTFQVHTNDKVFQCPQCDKGFKELRTLRLHLKIHNSEYPEQCSVCQKVFRTKWQLKQHQVSHLFLYN